MRIEEMHWELELVYNKIASNHKKRFTDAEKDRILQRAITEYKDIFYSGNNSKKYKLGFEVTQQRIDMLHTLVVGEPEQPALTPFTSSNNIYEFKLSDLVHPYCHHLRSYITTKECKLPIKVKIKQSGDLDKILEDENSKPSLVWKRAIGRIRKSSDTSDQESKSLYIYTGGLFTPIGLYMEYLKEPAQVCLGTYTQFPTIDNPNPTIIKPQVHCDLPSEYHNLVIDIAAIEIARILEDVNRIQVRSDRLNNIS